MDQNISYNSSRPINQPSFKLTNPNSGEEESSEALKPPDLKKNLDFSVSQCRVRSRPARTTRPPVLLTAVYSANFSLHLSTSSFSSSISPEPRASHSYILSVLIHSQQATSPHQACSFSQSGRQGHVSTKYGLV